MKKIIQILLAVITWAAVITQYYLMIENRVAPVGETTIRFFSFFTILTNILVAFYFTIVSLTLKGSLHSFFAKYTTLTAVTMYILVVGLVYQVLLRHVWQPEGLQMIVDELLHTIIPSAVLIYWILHEGGTALSYKVLFYWLIYPGCYLIWILLRGYASGFYPYPFVHVANLGLSKVLINSAGLLAFFAALSLLFIFIASIRRSRLNTITP